jgi:hypothetical protein
MNHIPSYPVRTRAKASKFNARKTVVDGYAFHSAGEAKRWGQLRLLEMAGSISDLRRQVPFDLWAWGWEGRVKIGVYKADFVYVENGQKIVEDFKGMKTAHYARTKRIFEANYYPLKIKETRA